MPDWKTPVLSSCRQVVVDTAAADTVVPPNQTDSEAQLATVVQRDLAGVVPWEAASCWWHIAVLGHNSLDTSCGSNTMIVVYIAANMGIVVVVVAANMIAVVHTPTMTVETRQRDYPNQSN